MSYYSRHRTTGNASADVRMKNLGATVGRAVLCLLATWALAWAGLYLPLESTIGIAYAITALPPACIAFFYGFLAWEDLMNYLFGAR